MSFPVSLDAVVQAVEQALADSPVLRRLSVLKRTAFAMDLALIALDCRCAWLVDVAVNDAEHVCPDLLRALCQIHPIFAGVQHWFEPDSQQSFFVNTARCDALATTPMLGVSFVLLCRGQDPRLLADPPPDVLAALRALPARLPALAPATLIPLAAVLLGYPVAYVPADDADGAFLAHTPLDVYTCTVRAHAPHTLLKFSCPAGLSGLAPPQITDVLATRFGPRVRELGLALSIEHATEVMDRVAL